MFDMFNLFEFLSTEQKSLVQNKSQKSQNKTSSRKISNSKKSNHTRNTKSNKPPIHIQHKIGGNHEFQFIKLARHRNNPMLNSTFYLLDMFTKELTDLVTELKRTGLHDIFEKIDLMKDLLENMITTIMDSDSNITHEDVAGCFKAYPIDLLKGSNDSVFSHVKIPSRSKNVFEIIKKHILSKNPKLASSFAKSKHQQQRFERLLFYSFKLYDKMKSTLGGLRWIPVSRFSTFNLSSQYTDERPILRVKCTQSLGLRDITTGQVTIKPEVELFDSFDVSNKSNHLVQSIEEINTSNNSKEQNDHQQKMEAVSAIIERYLADAQYSLSESIDWLRKNITKKEEPLSQVRHLLLKAGTQIIENIIKESGLQQNQKSMFEKAYSIAEKYDEIDQRLNAIKAMREPWFDVVLQNLTYFMISMVQNSLNFNSGDDKWIELIEQTSMGFMIVYLFSKNLGLEMEVMFIEKGQEFYPTKFDTLSEYDPGLLTVDDCIHFGIMDGRDRVLVKAKVELVK